MGLGLAVILGILQGLTEFLPVSSSGHLALFGHWFGLAEADLTFDILVHLATLAAIFVYFRKDWFELGRLILKKQKGELPRWVIPYLLVSMVPAGLVGVFFKDWVADFHARPVWVGWCLIFTGFVLLGGFRIQGKGKPLNELGWMVVIAMGLTQALAILPGVSRSGITIMTGLYLGMNRDASARFSFLMAAPVIGGAGLLTIIDLAGQIQTIAASQWMAYAAGFVAALISGFFALAFLMKLLTDKRFFYFAFYCFALGLTAIFI